MARSSKRTAASQTRARPRGKSPPKKPAKATASWPDSGVEELTPEIATEICGYLRKGLSQRAAVGAAGVLRRTLMRWQRAAQRGEEPFAKFADAMELAAARGVAFLHLLTAKGGDQGRSASWLLERVASSDYGFKQQMTLTLEQGVERLLDVIETELGSEAAARVYRRLAAERGGEAAQEPRGEEPIH